MITSYDFSKDSKLTESLNRVLFTSQLTIRELIALNVEAESYHGVSRSLHAHVCGMGSKKRKVPVFVNGVRFQGNVKALKAYPLDSTICFDPSHAPKFLKEKKGTSKKVKKVSNTSKKVNASGFTSLRIMKRKNDLQIDNKNAMKTVNGLDW